MCSTILLQSFKGTKEEWWKNRERGVDKVGGHSSRSYRLGRHLADSPGLAQLCVSRHSRRPHSVEQLVSILVSTLSLSTESAAISHWEWIQRCPPTVRPAMLLRRKLWVVSLIAAIFILMFASQTIHRRHFLPLSLSLPTVQSTPTSRETDVGSSGWFSQRYDSKQQPILQDTNNNFDPDALRWWLGLQRSGNDQTLEEVMSKMFQVISPPTVDLRPLPSLCRSCAVVGNSGNLRQSSHGDLINSHNSVIRMNKAVTRGFEKDVGNRTTHHFLYPESAVDVAPGRLEWLTSALSTGQIKMTYMRVKDRVMADKDKVLVVNPTFFKYVHDHWTEHHGRYPSTGMLAIIFALHTCDQVSVFGYGADRQGNWHHYWEENRYAGAFRKTGVHSADFETQVIHQLAKESKITLYL
ncbi:hypothetical protein INR49_014167 [Caranx melampygus]|nr:hypothetical protein INR49_014167 [Caranx melampygus]